MKAANINKKTRFLPSTLEVEKSHPILSCVLQDATVNRPHDLHLAMLGCESSPPYGPNEHTAQLLLDTIALAARQHFQEDYDKKKNANNASPARAKLDQHCQFSIHIHIFDMQNNDYPGNWNAYDGFLLPGSFSSAQDRMPWIFKLQNLIQKELVAKHRSTLAICFGHQLLVKSFRKSKIGRLKDGVVRVGRHVMQTSIAGKHLFGGRDQVNLYYTNSETVKKLPDIAVCLGGSSAHDDDDDDDEHDERIQAAAYFTSLQDADQWRQSEFNESELPHPFAVSFQGHPEYACSRKLGLERTFQACLDEMEQRGVIDVETKQHAINDASSCFEHVQEDSIHVMVQVGRWLGWFPTKEQKSPTQIWKS